MFNALENAITTQYDTSDILQRNINLHPYYNALAFGRWRLAERINQSLSDPQTRDEYLNAREAFTNQVLSMNRYNTEGVIGEEAHLLSDEIIALVEAGVIENSEAVQIRVLELVGKRLEIDGGTDPRIPLNAIERIQAIRTRDNMPIIDQSNPRVCELITALTTLYLGQYLDLVETENPDVWLESLERDLARNLFAGELEERAHQTFANALARHFERYEDRRQAIHELQSICNRHYISEVYDLFRRFKEEYFLTLLDSNQFDSPQAIIASDPIIANVDPRIVYEGLLTGLHESAPLVMLARLIKFEEAGIATFEKNRAYILEGTIETLESQIRAGNIAEAIAFYRIIHDRYQLKAVEPFLQNQIPLLSYAGLNCNKSEIRELLRLGIIDKKCITVSYDFKSSFWLAASKMDFSKLYNYLIASATIIQHYDLLFGGYSLNPDFYRSLEKDMVALFSRYQESANPTDLLILLDQMKRAGFNEALELIESSRGTESARGINPGRKPNILYND